jgi:hypothetical protein
MARRHFSFFVFSVCTLFASVGRAQTSVNLNATQDAFVSGANASGNYGGAGALGFSASPTQSPANTKGEFDSLIEFNFASAVSNFNSTYGVGQWTIQSITLQLFNAAPNNGIFNANASGSFTLNWMESVTSSNNWVEGTGTPSIPTTTGITFNSLPGFQNAADELLGTYSYTASSSGSNTYALGLPGGFLSSVMAGNIVSIDMLPVESSGVSSVVNSRSGPNPPVVSVTAVPEPTSVLLFLGSTLLMGSLRRRVWQPERQRWPFIPTSLS